MKGGYNAMCVNCENRWADQKHQEDYLKIDICDDCIGPATERASNTYNSESHMATDDVLRRMVMSRGIKVKTADRPLSYYLR